MTLALAAALSALALPSPNLALAQVPAAAPAPAVAPAPAAAPRLVGGVSPQAAAAWLVTQGATPGPIQQDQGRTYMRVTADGLTWLLFFQSCDNGLCSDLQFSAGAEGPAVTSDLINGWNKDRRFLKAIYEAPQGSGPASAVIQYDVLLNGDGPEQLIDHLAIWRSLLPEFARLTMGAAAAGPTPAQ